MLRTNGLAQITYVRVREFLREPGAIFWMFVFPVILASALGLAFREKGLESFKIGVIQGAGAEQLAAYLDESPNLRAEILPRDQGDLMLRNGKIAVLVIPGSPHQYRYDPARQESQLARMMTDDAIQRGAGRSDPIPGKDKHVSEVGLRYIDFLIPGLLGLNLMGSGMWGLGFAIVQMRSKHLLKRFIASPMRKRDYLLGLVFSRMVFLFLEIAAVVGAGYLLFGVPVRGTLPGLFFIALLGSMAFAGMGILCAARARTVEGIAGILNFVMLPMWILSGVFFSTNRFPEAMQPVIQLLPLTALNDALRSIMLDGSTVMANASEVLIILVWGIVPFSVALRLFRWR